MGDCLTRNAAAYCNKQATNLIANLNWMNTKVCEECGEEFCTGTCIIFQYDSYQVFKNLPCPKKLLKSSIIVERQRQLIFHRDFLKRKTKTVERRRRQKRKRKEAKVPKRRKWRKSLPKKLK